MRDRKLRRGHRRRSERLSAEIPIQLAWAAETGEVYLENSQTLTLSKHGASILSKRKLNPKREMIIRLETGQEARVRVAGKIGDRNEGYVYAVEFLDPLANLWASEFPSTPDLNDTDELAYLVCGCCGKSESVHLGESKLADFEVAHGLLLYCIQCEAMTRWIQRSSDDAPTGDEQNRGDKSE
jgi:hypothetical protein